MDSQKSKDFFKFHVNRSTINLAKNFLEILEDLRDENIISMEKYGKLRTKILNSLGDCNRNIETLVEQFSIKM